jgi:hypothetical protein
MMSLLLQVSASSGIVWHTISKSLAPTELEANATNVRVAIFSPTDAQGMGLPAIVVMSGIHDGWLMAIATFGDRTSCR